MAEPTKDEKVRQSYTVATQWLREKHPDEFNLLRIKAAKDLGVEWKPRPTKEQKAKAELDRLLAEPNPARLVGGAGGRNGGVMRTSEVLYLSADRVEEGWVQERLISRDGQRVCAMGGIGWVVGTLPHLETYSVGGLSVWYPDSRHPAVIALSDYLVDKYDFHSGRSRTNRVIDWNDKSGQTKGEVVATMRAAALIEEAKELAEMTVLTPEPVTAMFSEEREPVLV